MQNQPPTDEDHADDIFGTAIYEAPVRQKKDFLPWHRPRKQFVRHYQWYRQIDALLNDTQPEDNTFRYLGLPGVDLLDLRYFHRQICEPKKRRFIFLGFNSGVSPTSDAQTELNISLDEVRRLTLIDPRSNIIPDDFRRVADQASIAWRSARDLGPYHVINLDLCDGFGLHAPSQLENTHYTAVNNLLTLQARSKDPWLLLLTTRAGKEHIHTEVLERLLNKYAENLAGCLPFRDASTEIFTISSELILREVVRHSDGLLKVFLVGLCKWLVGLAVSHNPPMKVEVRSVIGYRIETHAEQEDLVSLAIRFTPTLIPVKDSVGLASQSVQVQMPDECDLAVKALRRIAKRKNADTILASDPVLLDEMVAATASLLELARYDVSAYREWLLLFSDN